MKKKNLIYLVITIIFIFLSVLLLTKTDLSNDLNVSKVVQVILILYLIRISIGCTFYIKQQYKKKKYSYGIIMNLGLLLFININILRQLNLLIVNWDELNISTIYNNTLRSFSYFAMLTLPCIIILALYSIITNIVLIKKEGFSPYRLLGVILGFLSLAGLFGAQGIYYLISNLLINTDKQFIKYTIDLCVNASLSYFYTLIIAYLYCNIKAAKHIPTYDKDFAIILGAKVRDDGKLTPLLRGRVDKAIEFAKNQYKETKKKIIYIPSGGKGSDEKISEAKAIKNYLLEQGIKEDQIIIEDKSINTYQNMKFSKEKINQINKDGKVIFVTTNYHVFRSGVIANEQGIDCEGTGSKTKWYFYSNALIREFMANLVSERKKHIALLVIINIIMLILIAIGRYYEFLIIN
jgi:uncharacterized SAM-binding protein YcdF (DUF218 family)